MSDTPETDDFTFGDHRKPRNSKGESFYEAINRVERERDDAKADRDAARASIELWIEKAVKLKTERDEAREIAEGMKESAQTMAMYDIYKQTLPWEVDISSGSNSK